MTKKVRNLYEMGRTNDKTDANPAMLRDLSERISNCARKFDEVSSQMESKQIKAIALALDTFKKLTLDRLEAFSRTVEREFNRTIDMPKAISPDDIAVVAKQIDDLSTNVGKRPKPTKKEPSKNKAQTKKRGSA